MTGRSVAVALAVLVGAATLTWLARTQAGQPVPPERPSDPRGRTPAALHTSSEPRSAGVPSGARAASTPRAEPDPDTGAVVLRATWAATGEPAVGIGFAYAPEVRPRREAAARTGADGTARVDGLTAGYWRFVRDLYAMDTVRVTAGGTTELHWALPASPVVTGRVLDHRGGAAAAAEVSWSGDSGALRGRVRADAQGRFQLTQLPANITVDARRDDYVAAPVYISLLNPGEQFELELRLDEHLPALAPATAGGVRVRVVGPDGAPLPGVAVALRRITAAEGIPGARRVGAATGVATDDGGIAAIGGVGPGVVEARASGTGWLRGSARIEVGPGRTRDVEIALVRAAELRGVVRGADGAPAPHARIAVLGESNPSKPGVTADARGRFLLGGLAGGALQVEARHPSCGRAQAALRIESGSLQEWHPTLQLGRAIRGRVLDERGTPLAGWIVEAYGARRLPWVRTGEDGRFCLAGCGEEPHRLTVQRRRSFTDWPLLVREDVQPDDVELVLVLDPHVATAFLTGAVLDDTGAPAHGLKVHVFDPHTRWNHVFPVDGATGRFRTGPLPAAELEVELHDHRKRWPTRVLPRVQLADREVRDLGTHLLERGGLLRATLDRNGISEATRVWARVFRDDGAWAGNARVHDDAIELYTALDAGSYRLAVGGRGVCWREYPFELHAGETTELRVPLASGVGCDVAVGFAEPVQGNQRLRLVLRNAAGAAVLRRETWVAPNGALQLVLAPDRYVLELSDDAGRRGRAELQVTDLPRAEPVSLDLR